MAVKLERLVKTYYENLDKGIVLGRKCPKCGAIEWPPVYACNTCGSLETEWVEMSGKGELKMLIMPTVMSFKPAYKDLEPYAYGEVKTAEGPERNVMVLGVTKKNEQYVRDHMPFPVHMQVVQRDGYKTCVFALDPIEGQEVTISTGGFTAAPAPVEEAPAAEAAPAPAAAPAGELYTAETLETLMDLVAAAYKKDVSELAPATSFESDLKAPSVVFVGLVAQIENEFDQMISITDASAAGTIGGLAALIDKTAGVDFSQVAPAAAPAAAAPAAAPAAAADAGASSETLEKLMELVAKAYRKDISELSAATTFEGDLKAPSVVFVGLVAQIENEFDKLISITDASAAGTIGGLAALIEKAE